MDFTAKGNTSATAGHRVGSARKYGTYLLAAWDDGSDGLCRVAEHDNRSVEHHGRGIDGEKISGHELAVTLPGGHGEQGGSRKRRNGGAERGEVLTQEREANFRFLALPISARPGGEGRSFRPVARNLAMPFRNWNRSPKSWRAVSK